MPSFLDLKALCGLAVENGNKLLKALLDRNKANYNKKTLKPFGIERAAKLAGCTTNHVRTMEKRGDLPEPEYKESGKTSFMRRTYTLKDVNRIRKAIGKLPRRPSGAKAIRVVISNLKGGVAKTTTAVHLAQRLALDGYRVLLVDTDPQATATCTFGYQPDLDLEQEDTMLHAMVDDRDHIKKVIRKTYWDQLDLIPSQLSLQNVDYLLPSKEQSKIEKMGDIALRLRNALDVVEDNYDVIVVDTPPALGMMSINCMVAAEYLIIPVTPYMYDLASSVQYFSVLDEVTDSLDETNFNARKVNLLISRHDGTPESNKQVQEVASAYGPLLLPAYMGTTKSLQTSSKDQLSLYEITVPRGSRDTYNRAMLLMDGVNNEIINNIHTLWAEEADEHLSAVTG